MPPVYAYSIYLYKHLINNNPTIAVFPLAAMDPNRVERLEAQVKTLSDELIQCQVFRYVVFSNITVLTVSPKHARYKLCPPVGCFLMLLKTSFRGDLVSLTNIIHLHGDRRERERV